MRNYLLCLFIAVMALGVKTQTATPTTENRDGLIPFIDGFSSDQESIGKYIKRQYSYSSTYNNYDNIPSYFLRKSQS